MTGTATPGGRVRIYIDAEGDGVDRGVKQAEAALKRLGVATEAQDQKSQAFARTTDKQALSFRGLGEAVGDVTKVLKTPALIAGAGGAAQGLSAVSAGAVGLTSALAPLSGALIAYPSLLGGFAQATGVVALAGVDDLSGAIGGLNEKLDEESEAFKKLSPQAQDFAREAQKIKGPLRELQGIAQKRLFSGADEGLEQAIRNFDSLESVVDDTAGTMGHLVTEAGRFVGREGFGRDFEKIGRNNAQLLGDMGEAGFNFGDALRNILVPAGPLLDFIGEGTVSFSKFVEEQTKAGRESGRTAAFFRETEDAIERVTSIGGSLTNVLIDIGVAAKPLGDSILKELDQGANDLERWADSIEGKDALGKFFADAEGPIDEAGRLIGDLVKTFFRLSQTPGLEDLIRKMRVDLLPVMEEMVASTTAAFGPKLVDLLVQVGEVFATFAGSSGPLVRFTELMTEGLDVFNDLLAGNDALKTLAVTFVGIAGTVKAMKFVGAITGLTTLVGLYKDLGSAAKGATAAQAAGTALSTTAAATSAALPAEQLVAGSSMFGGQARAMGESAGDAAATGLRSRLGAGVKGLASDFGSAFGNYAGPLAAAGIGTAIAGIQIGNSGWVQHNLLGMSGSEDNSFIKSLREQVSSFDDAGLDNLAADAKDAGRAISRDLVEGWIRAGDVSEEQGKRIIAGITEVREQTQQENWLDFKSSNKTFSSNLEAMERGFLTTMGAIRKAGRENSAEIASELGEGSAAGRRAQAANYKAMAENVDRLVERQVISTREGEKRKEELLRRAKLVTATEDQAEKMGKAWTKGLKDQEQFTQGHVKDVLADLRKMPPAAAKVASQVWLGQLREAAKNNPKLMDEFRDLRATIVDELGVAAVRGTGKAEQLQQGVGGNLQLMAAIGGTAVATLITNTNNALGPLGADRVDFQLAKDPNGKSLGRQGGGSVFQVPGHGTGDSFQTTVPPGTFILNRNAVNEFFGLQSGGAVPVVLEPGELAFDPAAVAQMGGFLQWANSEVPRYAEGGMAMPGAGVMRKYPGLTNDTDFVPALGNALSRLASAAGTTISVTEGFRTYAQQAALYAKYGPGRAAPPGSSNHERGFAADISPGYEVLGRLAGKFGLVFPLLNTPGLVSEPWHIELANPNAPAGKAAGATRIKRVVIDGPDGRMKDGAQGASDLVWKAANRHIASQAPKGAGPMTFPKGGEISAKTLPPALQKWNKRFPGAVLQNDPTGWANLTTMPFNVAAAIAEWAGMPGVTMAQMSKGEGGLKPGSMGDDNGDGNPDGYGWLAITRPYGDSYGVKELGGYEGMLNPVSNAIVASRMLKAQGLGAWYGNRFVTDPNAHYTGPLLKRQRGGIVGMAKGGYTPPIKGPIRGSGPTPPSPGVNPIYGIDGFIPQDIGDVGAPTLSYEQQMTAFAIGLTYAEDTTDTADDLAILQQQLALVQEQTDKATGRLSRIRVNKDDKAAALKATAGLQKKLAKSGGQLTAKERKRLDEARETAAQESMAGRRGEMLDELSGLTSELSSTKDSIENLNQTASEQLSEIVDTIKGLAEAMAAQNALLSSETNIQRAELIRVIADIVDGELGSRVDAYSSLGAYGQVTSQ